MPTLSSSNDSHSCLIWISSRFVMYCSLCDGGYLYVWMSFPKKPLKNLVTSETWVLWLLLWSLHDLEGVTLFLFQLRKEYLSLRWRRKNLWLQKNLNYMHVIWTNFLRLIYLVYFVQIKKVSLLIDWCWIKLSSLSHVCLWANVSIFVIVLLCMLRFWTMCIIYLTFLVLHLF